MSALPRPYQLLAELVRIMDMDGTLTPGPRALAQDLVQELWRAGQDEHRAGMGTNDSDHDAPLWCGGMFIHDVTAAVGVPTVPPSDPARDLGRGRTIR